MRRHLFTVLRVALILAGIGYILWVVQWNDAMVTPEGGGPAVLRPGMLTLLREASPGWLLGGLVLVSVVWPLQAWRWWLLIRCRGLEVSFVSVLRLVMVGLFFNFCVPLGSNGGDVVKAYGAARTMTAPGSKSTMVISVLLDRMSGMIGLLLLAGVMGLFMWNDPTGQRVTVISWTVLLGLLVGGAVYVSPFTRRWLGLSFLEKLPGVQKIDRAITGYRGHRGVLLAAVGLSLPVHICLALATAMAGYALGVPTPLLTLMVALPVTFLVGSMPLGYLGLGVMEATAQGLLSHDAGEITGNQIVGMLMAYRLYLLAYGLIGAVVMTTSGMHLREMVPDADDPGDVFTDAAEAESHTTPV